MKKIIAGIRQGSCLLAAAVATIATLPSLATDYIWNGASGGLKSINVLVNDTQRPVSGSDGKYFLTSGGGFAGATVVKAVGCPDWVKDVGVEDGNIYANIKPIGTMIIVK